MSVNSPIHTTFGGAPVEDIRNPVVHREFEIQRQPAKNSPIYRQ
jgi:hypothetical protein